MELRGASAQDPARQHASAPQQQSPKTRIAQTQQANEQADQEEPGERSEQQRLLREVVKRPAVRDVPEGQQVEAGLAQHDPDRVRRPVQLDRLVPATEDGTKLKSVD